MRGGSRMVLRLLPLVVLLLPLAAAKETLADLEEPHAGTDKVWDVTIREDEANVSRVLLYRNPIGVKFGLVIYDPLGKEIFAKNGTRGVQTLPGLPAGEYRFYVRGAGAFQVTDKAFERTLKGDSVNATLNGTDAYVLAPTKAYNVTLDGNVSFEWLDMTGRPESLPSPTVRLAASGGAYVITVRGDPGAAYSIVLTATEAPPVTTNPTPGAPLVALLAIVGVLAVGRALGRGRKKEAGRGKKGKG